MRTIVIGASTGIGRGVAEKLAAAGHRVVAMQRKPWVPERGLYMEFDLEWDLPRIQHRMEEAAAAMGGLDALVVSGGMGAYLHTVYHHVVKALAEDLEPDSPDAKDYFGLAARLEKHAATAERMVRTNQVGVAHALESAFPLLADAGTQHAGSELPGPSGGRAVVIGSLIPRLCPPDLAWYGMSKAGIDTFVRSAPKKWGKRGVRCVSLATGWIRTPMIEEIEPRKKRKILAAIGTGRFGEVEEVAEAVRWVLQDAPDYLTCDTIPMSGGL